MLGKQSSAKGRGADTVAVLASRAKCSSDGGGGQLGVNGMDRPSDLKLGQ